MKSRKGKVIEAWIPGCLTVDIKTSISRDEIMYACRCCRLGYKCGYEYQPRRVKVVLEAAK